jgi:hypothetical protein
MIAWRAFDESAGMSPGSGDELAAGFVPHVAAT